MTSTLAKLTRHQRIDKYLVSDQAAQAHAKLSRDPLCGSDGGHAPRLCDPNQPAPVGKSAAPKTGLVQKLGHLQTEGDQWLDMAALSSLRKLSPQPGL